LTPNPSPTSVRGLLAAEWVKTTGNWVLLGFLVWVIPIGLATFFVLALIISVFSDESAMAMAATSSGQWTKDMAGIWSLLISYPGNISGRLLPLAFMSVLFAGEYQWGTWRLVLPRSERSAQILAKAVATTVVVVQAYLVASVVMGIGQSLTHRVVGLDYGPPVDAASALEFVRLYAGTLLLGIVSLLILAGFAALGAIVTRSILGGLLVGFGLSVLEPMSQVILILLGKLFHSPGVANLYQYAATYHLDNARAWIVNGSPLPAPMEGFTAEFGLLPSLIVLSLWVAGLLALAIFVFRRQDITT
jgi:ABC-type transport system involved in multi-copper enzyme maturation permease subunit